MDKPETLCTSLVQETKLLGSSKKEVESIKSELESSRSFLKDADGRATAEEEGVLTWVKQVREEAYPIEDVISDMLKDAKLPHGSGLIRFLHKLRHGVATEIEDMKSSLDKIHQRGLRYSFIRSTDHGLSIGTRNVIPHDSRVDSFFIEDNEVVGIEPTRDELIDQFVNGRFERSVIAVVGQGGLDKTTLAGKVFQSEAVKRNFEFKAWINVGKDYTRKDQLKTITQEFYRLTGSTPGG